MITYLLVLSTHIHIILFGTWTDFTTIMWNIWDWIVITIIFLYTLKQYQKCQKVPICISKPTELKTKIHV